MNVLLFCSNYYFSCYTLSFQSLHSLTSNNNLQDKANNILHHTIKTQFTQETTGSMWVFIYIIWETSMLIGKEMPM